MKYIYRFQEERLIQLLRYPLTERNVLLVEGARQVGKTTIIEQALKKIDLPIISLNLEERKLLRMKIDSCDEFSIFQELLKLELGFNPEKQTVFFVDEAQESNKIGGFIRFMKERWPKTHVVLSGSTLSRLFRQEQRFPVGRISRILITPFTFSEYLLSCDKNELAKDLQHPESISLIKHEMLLKELDDYLETGGLPAVVVARVKRSAWRELRQNLIADYNDDFRRIFGENKSATVQSCFRAVAQLAGSSFKNTMVMPSPTSSQNQEINDIYGRLEEWKMILTATQHGVSGSGACNYHPKRYLFDSGLLRDYREQAVPSLKVLSMENSAARIILGGLFENQVAIELARNGAALSGWKKSSIGTEIDFIVKTDHGVVPVECKACLKIKGTHLKGIIDYMTIYGVKTGFVVSFAPFQRIKCREGRIILNIPLYSAEWLMTMADSALDI